MLTEKRKIINPNLNTNFLLNIKKIVTHYNSHKYFNPLIIN